MSGTKTGAGANRDISGFDRETLVASILYMMSRYAVASDHKLAREISRHLAMLSDTQDGTEDVVHRTALRLQKYWLGLLDPKHAAPAAANRGSPVKPAESVKTVDFGPANTVSGVTVH